MNYYIPYATKTVSISGTVNNANGIKTSVATVASPVTYSSFNGTLGGTFSVPRTVSFTSTSHSSSYVSASTIVFHGTDINGAVITETLHNSTANGGETVVGSLGFLTVTSIVVAAQADTAGAYTFGVRDIVCSSQCADIRVGTTGNLKVGYPDGTTDTIPNVIAGEHLPYGPSIIYGDSSTTIQNITIAFKV